ncbi:head GIN domain-containing protein [Sphingomonas crusticola]|uniref:head GIN domain-containing protein n=1 Tax=Sphingomonas crusticola TaxID=1697973 RepID=UPI0013C362F0|nr:head GIN domain-containing protein [Sphingomonas crusticola]
MRQIILSALIAASAAAPALAGERSFPTGGNFDRVSNSTPFDVYVHTGKAPGIHAVGTDQALDRLRIENRGGQLRIGTKSGSWFSGWNWGQSGRLRIDVTVPMVSEVSLAGPGNMIVDVVRTRDFGAHVSGPGTVKVAAVEAGGVTLSMSGPGDISIAGHAGRAVMNVSGPGNIRAANLSLAEASVTVSGPGDVDANVTRTADVSVSGPGDVRIRGGARCSTHKSGPGSINCG